MASFSVLSFPHSYQSGYCLCAVTGLSGKGTQTGFLAFFAARSCASLNLVLSSFSSTVIPSHMLVASVDLMCKHSTSRDEVETKLHVQRNLLLSIDRVEKKRY